MGATRDRDRTRPFMRALWPKVPLNDEGDPEFASLEEARKVFNDSQILALVHKALYFLNYQREYHTALRERSKELAKIVNENPTLKAIYDAPETDDDTTP